MTLQAALASTALAPTVQARASAAATTSYPIITLQGIN